MLMTLLWTDIFFFLMVICAAGFLILRRSDPELRLNQKNILSKGRYKFAAVVLLIYLFIGFLDSLHFRSKNNEQEVISVLDIALRSYARATEKTYSAPFAERSFVPEFRLDEKGKIEEFYPTLNFKYHILGTDKVGRDVLYLALKSIRTGIIIGTVTTFVMLPFAILFGTFAGFFRGWVDDFIQFLYTTLSSIPGVLLIAAAMLSLQTKIEQDSDLRLLMLCVILGATSWTSLCRLLRGETLKLRGMEFIQASKVLGLSPVKIILKHIVPNLMHIVIITLVLDFSSLVLAEAVLSYVGVGVDPSSYSFGNMINAARLEMAREPIVWWSLLGAFLFMFGLVFAANIFSEAVQQTLNPRAENNVQGAQLDEKSRKVINR